MTRTDAPPSARPDKGLLALLAVCALLAVIYNFTVAIGYGPDEPRHINYIKLLLEEHTFPRLVFDGTKYVEYKGAHSLHPPLYYSLLVPFYAIVRGAGDNAWHIVRFLSTGICIASLVLLYQIALRFGSRRLALLATAQVGLLPMWGMIAGVINNDSASLFAQSALLWLLAVKFPRDKTVRVAALLGIALGLGALCKATNIICGGTSFAAYLVLQSGGIKTALRDKTTWARLGTALVVALLVCGAWYARSFALYGQLTPIESGFTNRALGRAPEFGALTVMMHPLFVPLLGIAFWSIFYSLWAQKDWIPELIRTPIYLGLAAYSLVAVAGNLRSRFVASKASGEADALEADTLPARLALTCSLSAFFVNVAICAAIAIFKHWGWAEGGRYLLPSLGGASLWAACGWRSLVGERGLRVVTVAWCLALIALNGVAVYWLVTFLNPTYVK